MIEVKIILTSVIVFIVGKFIIKPLDDSGHKPAGEVVAHIAVLALATIPISLIVLIWRAL